MDRYQAMRDFIKCELRERSRNAKSTGKNKSAKPSAVTSLAKPVDTSSSEDEGTLDSSCGTALVYWNDAPENLLGEGVAAKYGGNIIKDITNFFEKPANTPDEGISEIIHALSDDATRHLLDTMVIECKSVPQTISVGRVYFHRTSSRPRFPPRSNAAFKLLSKNDMQ